MTHQAANILLSACLLAVLVRLYFFDYREYRVQRTRFKLFVLRDELFAMAKCGELSFEDPAYGMLRVMMNGAIRFAARVSVLDMVIIHLMLRSQPGFSEARTLHSDRWRRALGGLSDEASAKLTDIRERYIRIMIEQTFLSSLLGTILILPFFCAFVLAGLSRECARRFYGWVLPRVGPELDVIATSEAEGRSIVATA